jgi:microsomal dipeptidase-like Zn-dependent dipeptidase
MSRFPVADFHCDLLCFLSRSPSHTPYDPAVRCAIPQLQQGNVRIQTLALFVETAPGSAVKGFLQAEIFGKLPEFYPQAFQMLRSREAEQLPTHIKIIAAVENSSAFCEEDDAIEQVFLQLERMISFTGKPAYVSLTWNSENRFGGGAATDIGLKEDGKRLLEYLAAKQIPLDLSHASDRLSWAILEFFDKEGLAHPVVASHSNLRAVAPVSRNLPDDLAREIIKRKGVIGLNFFRPFVGEKADDFFRQIDNLLRLGGADTLCFGADFFHDDDLSPKYRMAGLPFFPSFDNSSCYPTLLDSWEKEHSLPEPLLANIAYRNLTRFLAKIA